MQTFRRLNKLKVYKVILTGIIQTEDEEPHPENWDWSNEFMAYRLQEMGASTNVVITELKEVPAIDPAA